MEKEEIIRIFDPEQTDEELKKKTIKDEFEGLESPPVEEVIQTLMRIIKKPTISEASNGVYDAVVSYLKSISRF